MSRVIIVGAGPAGASLAFLLASRGVQVTLLERRRDFAREFRGEVLMPSGVDALTQMGLATSLESLPSYVQQHASVYFNRKKLIDQTLNVALGQERRFVAVSQPALLEMLVAKASAQPSFEFVRGAAVQALLRESGRVSGVQMRTKAGEQALAADLVIGADGRNSVVRRQLGVAVNEVSPPMDIVWCELPCPSEWLGVRAYAGRGHLLVAYRKWNNRLQLGWVILKGTFKALRGQGVESWVSEMANQVSADFAAHLRAHASAVQKPFLLDAVSDCVASWSQPGALLIGDAAHTMSPVGAQGVNVALRDAIVSANHLVPLMTADQVPEQALSAALKAIETERVLEIHSVQALQAQPPKLILSRAWWGEPVRWLAGTLLRQPAVQRRAAARAGLFFDGVTQVTLKV